VSDRQTQVTAQRFGSIVLLDLVSGMGPEIVDFWYQVVVDGMVNEGDVDRGALHGAALHD
jgi:hypothetical protein